MRKGPKSSSSNSPRRLRPISPPAVDSTRAGIRSLDCGDEMSADAAPIIRRDAGDASSVSTTPDQGGFGEQRPSV
jgi:hypothetical protein